MAFQLDSVVPWGRNLQEYRLMFQLKDNDMKKKIAGFGDGPASFNCEAAKQGCSVTSFDPIYQFSRGDLQKRIEEVRTTVMQQMKENMDNYVWTSIKNLEELEKVRMCFSQTMKRGKRNIDTSVMSCRKDCRMGTMPLTLA